MELSEIGPEATWAPEACTLPAAERPRRAAEFDGLFAAAMRGIERAEPTRLRLDLRPGPQTAARAAELAAAETGCCSFLQLHHHRCRGPPAPGHHLPEAHAGTLDLRGRPRSRRHRSRRGRNGRHGRHGGMSRMRSGQVARAAGLNRQTLRYYERRGLLAEPDRTPGGHRLYPAQTVTILRVIKAAQRLGFSLEEVAELLETGRHQHRGQPEAGLRQRAAAKLSEVEAKIAGLSAVADTLRAALDAGCTDLIECAAQPQCPLPFAALASAAVAAPGSRARSK